MRRAQGQSPLAWWRRPATHRKVEWRGRDSLSKDHDLQIETSRCLSAFRDVALVLFFKNKFDLRQHVVSESLCPQ